MAAAGVDLMVELCSAGSAGRAAELVALVLCCAAVLVALLLCCAGWQLPSYVRFPRLTWRAVELLQ